MNALVLLLASAALQALPLGLTCTWQEVTSMQDGVVHIELVEVCSSTEETADGEAPPPRDSNLDARCVATAISLGEDPFEFCDIPPEDAEAVLTPDVVLAAFRRIPLPAQELRVQPANGRTLVNFATNFYTDADPFDRSLTLLGQQVDLRITPSAFTWRYGDGATASGSDPGAAYPDLRVTHKYQRRGTVRPSVDTTYSATYRVNGGAWRDVPGTVTIAGPSVALDVLTATPTLVGH